MRDSRGLIEYGYRSETILYLIKVGGWETIMRSFKGSDHINEKRDGPYRGFVFCRVGMLLNYLRFMQGGVARFTILISGM